MKCEEFSVVDKERRSCIKPDCVGREFITKEGTCEQCPLYVKPTEDKMSCAAQKCDDEKDSIGPDGECHDYDESLEGKYEELKLQANECALSVKGMIPKI